MTDAAIVGLVRQLKISPEAFQGVCDTLSEANVFTTIGIDPHLRAIVKEFNSVTWFATQGISEIVSQGKGARPGDVFADILFNVLVADVLDHLKAVFIQEELFTTIKWDGTKTMLSEASQGIDLP